MQLSLNRLISLHILQGNYSLKHEKSLKIEVNDKEIYEYKGKTQDFYLTYLPSESQLAHKLVTMTQDPTLHKGYLKKAIQIDSSNFQPNN